MALPSPGEKTSPAGIQEQIEAVSGSELTGNNHVADTEFDDFDESGEEQPRPGVELKLPNPFPDNPVFTTLRTAFAKRTSWGLLTILPGLRFDENTYQRFSNLVDDLPTLERKLGKLPLVALVQDDTEFISVLREAMKGADEIFHRGERPALLRQFWAYLGTLPAPLPSIGAIKSGFVEKMAKSSPNGFELSGSQWKSLRDRTFTPDDYKRGKPGPHGGKK